MGKLLIAAACLFFVRAASQAQDPAPDPIAAKITAAKDAFYAERDKAELALIALLEKKEAAAKQAGDLKNLEAVRAELDAFRKDGILPKLVPLSSYEAAIKIARTRLGNAFQAAIKAYTVADKISEAKMVQEQLDRILSETRKSSENTDLVQKDTVWVSVSGKFVFTILQRKGEEFRARIDWDSDEGKYLLEVTGTIRDGKLEWKAKDTKIIRGGSDKVFDYIGETGKDEIGDKITTVHFLKNNKKPVIVLYLKK